MRPRNERSLPEGGPTSGPLFLRGFPSYSRSDVQSADPSLTTGVTGLDGMLKGILPGDNIVWQVDTIEDYLAFATPYCEAARRSERRLIYFRFARHAPLLPAGVGAEVHELHPEAGFESFIADIHHVIKEAGWGAFYVFDCLSDLAADWYSDQMLGNFFMLTCPLPLRSPDRHLLRSAQEPPLLPRDARNREYDAALPRRVPP